MNRKDTALLRKFDACEPALDWCKTVPDLETAWNTCKRSDWMLWALDRIGYNDNEALRLYACACVRGTPLADGRTVWDLLTDQRSKDAVEVSERYAMGQATDKELAAARAAAWAAWAAAAARAAARAAADAAWAANDAAAVAAANAAAWAANYADDATAWEWQANKLREFVTWDQVQKGIAAVRRGVEK